MRSPKTITASVLLAACVIASQAAIAAPGGSRDCLAPHSTVPNIVGLYPIGNPSSRGVFAQDKLVGAGLCLPLSLGRRLRTPNPVLDGRIARQIPRAGTRVSRFANVKVQVWEYRPPRKLFRGSLSIYNALPDGTADVGAGTITTLEGSSPYGYVIRSSFIVPRIKKDIFAYEVFVGIQGDAVFAGASESLFGANLGVKRALSFRVIKPGASSADVLVTPERLASWSNSGTIHVWLDATMVSLREREELTADTDQISLAALEAQFSDGQEPPP